MFSSQGVTKRCHLSWLTTSALVWTQIRGEGGVAGSQPMSTAVHCTWSPNKLWRSNSLFNLFFQQKTSYTHTPPPPLTHSILIHTGKGGRVEPKRRGNRGEYRSQSWVENTNMTECTQEIGCLQSINSDKHLPQSPLTGQFFRWRHFALTSVSLIFLILWVYYIDQYFYFGGHHLPILYSLFCRFSKDFFFLYSSVLEDMKTAGG
jgi:hypothetical protein